MGDALVVLLVVAALLAVLLSLDYRDGKRFSCLFAEDRDIRAVGGHGYFQYSEESQTFVNRGEREVCIEDIVNFVNRRRMGSDNEMNTADDSMTFEQQVDMLDAMLEANFHGGYWASSPWYFQYTGGTPVLSKLLYSDTDEVLTITGSRTSFNGMFDTGATAESLFLLEGVLRLQRKAPLRAVLLAPLLQTHATDIHIEPIGAEGELWKHAFRIKKGKQLLYGTAGTAGEGAFLLHYYNGSMLSIALWKFIWPCLKAGDIWSAWGFASAFGESFYRNGILPVGSLFFKKDDSWWVSRMNYSEKEATAAAFSEEVYAEEVETGEEDAMPAFRRQMELLKQEKRLAAAQRQVPALAAAKETTAGAMQQQRQPLERQKKGEREGTQEWREEEEEQKEEEESERERMQQKIDTSSTDKKTSTPEHKDNTDADEEEGEEKEMNAEDKKAGEKRENTKAKTRKEAFSRVQGDEDEEEMRRRDSIDTTGGREEEEPDAPEEEDLLNLAPPTYPAAWEGAGDDAGPAEQRGGRMEQSQMSEFFSSDIFKETLQRLKDRIDKEEKKWQSQDDIFTTHGEDDLVGHEEL